jgi:deoxycytidine triphosphate deaminase
MLNDEELGKLLGTVILDADPSCIRTNSYVVRLGGPGEFLNVGKEFLLGTTKKGLKVQPGHSVALTALETVDFRRETVRKLYPNHDLCGIISPTTDLSREGIVAPTTIIDAGYHGTPNWTITNTSNEERRFTYGERIFRVTVLKLVPGETPSHPYEGDYQGQFGYVRSKRKGAPVGMRADEWEDSTQEGTPEALLENLMKAGYPWHALGTRLKIIDGQFESVTNEYGKIVDSLNKLRSDLDNLTRQHGDANKTMPEMIRNLLQQESTALQNRWLLATGTMLFALVGLSLTIVGNEKVSKFLISNGSLIGVLVLICSAVAFFLITRHRKSG